jgi:hypothetical protein
MTSAMGILGAVVGYLFGILVLMINLKIQPNY